DWMYRCRTPNRKITFMHSMPHTGRHEAEKSTLGELWLLARLAQTHLLAFYLTGVTCHEACLRRTRAQRLALGHHRTRDALPDRTRLPNAAAAAHADAHIELARPFNQFQRLLHDHARNFATENANQRAVIDGDRAVALGQEHAR